MQALMMDRALTLPSILEYAAQYHPDRQVVDRTVEGPIHRYGYAQALARTRRMANALLAMGVKPGDRVATLAWSTHRHFELYFAVTGIGAILHTINPRLHADQIVWVANHAEDSVLFFDITFAGQVAELSPRMPLVKTFVAMTDRAHLPAETLAGALVYEDLIEASSAAFAWPEIDEKQASGLCYTSGTTGNPKGVLYSHRSTVLHAMALGLPDAFNFSARDVVMPCAQMYHANAWCTPYAAPLVGATLVLPGRALDGASIAELIEAEGGDLPAGRADHLGGRGRPPGRHGRAADLGEDHRRRRLGAHRGPGQPHRGPAGRPGPPDLGHDRDQPAGRHQHPRCPTTPARTRRRPCNAS